MAATEEKMPSKPRQLWDHALHAVKGDQTQVLVERFTGEMTLIAEGLVEDQAKLHRDFEKLEAAQERSVQGLIQGQEQLTRSVAEQQRDLERRIDDLLSRVDEMGKRLASMERQLSKKPEEDKKHRHQTLIQQLTIPIAIVCATAVIVSIINLLH